jgi:hypothetical protein
MDVVIITRSRGCVRSEVDATTTSGVKVAQHPKSLTLDAGTRRGRTLVGSAALRPAGLWDLGPDIEIFCWTISEAVATLSAFLQANHLIRRSSCISLPPMSLRLSLS